MSPPVEEEVDENEKSDYTEEDQELSDERGAKSESDNGASEKPSSNIDTNDTDDFLTSPIKKVIKKEIQSDEEAVINISSEDSDVDILIEKKKNLDLLIKNKLKKKEELLLKTCRNEHTDTHSATECTSTKKTKTETVEKTKPSTSSKSEKCPKNVGPGYQGYSLPPIDILLSMQWTKNEKPKNPISDRMVKSVVEQYSSYLRAELKKKEQPAEVLKALREKRSQQRQARKGKKLYTIKNGKRHYVNKREKKSAEADADMSHNSDSDQSKETPVHDVVPAEDSSSDESSNGRDSNCSQSHGVGPENTEEVDVEDNESQIINLDQNGQELYSHLSADFITTRASKRSHDGDELQWSELSDASETSNLNSGTSPKKLKEAGEDSDSSTDIESQN
ncbi:uncharacterized protein LOC113215618 [Frankliniella occidentalis]|uniref:Uncharacterized protein LOC113215618 n=1 Tax=Frankliniella occidentalis TaxID=133901 RepID=A0A9C6WWG5_FRAOC|nr:uncharacterized protein LOC113215618 [Frankliniella occidentalis]